MPVSADTIPSPVTTVYNTAPKAAAAMVPMAYSAVPVSYQGECSVATPSGQTLTD